MQKIVFYICILVFAGSVSAQSNTAPSKPQSKPVSNNTQPSRNSNRQAELERQREAKLAVQRQQSYQRLRNLGSVSPSIPTRVRVYRDVISQYYRKPNKKELLAIEPSQDDKKKHSVFLKSKHAGILRLVPDAGCASSTKVLVVSPECQKYSMPGGGSSFSFRTENYRIPRLADLTFTGKSLIAKGVLLEAIFVSLGDRPLGQISLKTDAVGFLRSMKPSETVEEAYDFAQELSEGTTRDGFVYGRGVLAKENTSFALRSIAFRGKWLNAAGGVTYNELEFDKRRDVIVAFRIVRKDSDGSLIILWKRLQNIRSPKIEIEVSEVRN